MISSTSHSDPILFQLFVVFAVAKLAAEIFERLKQPAVVGEILAGVLLGPSVLGWIHGGELLSALSEIGVVFLLFTVGLEVKPSSLFKVGRRAFSVASLGVLVPFIMGWGLMRIHGELPLQQIFIGAALVATRGGITARGLAGLGKLSSETAQIILAAAVIDDILGLLILSGVSALAKGHLNYMELATTAGLSIAFILFMIFLSSRLMKKSQGLLDKLKVGHAYFVVGLILCFGLSYLATKVGVAAIIGAFFAGMALSEISEGTEIHHYSVGVMEFLVPFFLVEIGLQLELNVFKDWHVISLSLLLTVFAVASKILGCGLGALGMDKKSILKIGVGMVPRGEVGIIVAQIGFSMGVLNSQLYAVVVFMAVATTLLVPPFLKILFSSKKRAARSG
ncbi:MAG: cation:proton antiporter [Deltaproteobacteria bacterium]|nr:cation:proton antiporter [Deltaproteobacteria bacterium]